MSASHANTLSLRNLGRRFGTTQALDGFTLDLAAGEFVALLGPSGCGKTTALRMVAGFERPDTGHVEIGGVDVTQIPSQKRDVGMVFQSYSLFPNMNARENVDFGLRLRRRKTPESRRRAGELLELVGLAEHTSKFPHQLSGGQQQRVALARALAIEPRVLLLDEPLSALDAKVRVELRDQIKALQQRLGITTLFVTHDQEEALSMSDRVVVMNKGHAEQIASPAEIYAHPSTVFTAEFVGVSSRLPAERVGQQVRVLGVTVAARNPDVTDSDIDVLLRPEEITVTLDESGSGRVVRSSFLGATSRLEVETDDSVVKVDVPTADGIAPGNRVTLNLRADAVLVAPRVVKTAVDS